MALTDYVIMPGADYQDACDAIRERDGSTGAIKSGELGEKIRSLVGVQTGTVTITLHDTVPSSDGRMIIRKINVQTTQIDPETREIFMAELGVSTYGNVPVTKVVENVVIGGALLYYWETGDPGTQRSRTMIQGLRNLPGPSYNELSNWEVADANAQISIEIIA